MEDWNPEPFIREFFGGPTFSVQQDPGTPPTWLILTGSPPSLFMAIEWGGGVEHRLSFAITVPVSPNIWGLVDGWIKSIDPSPRLVILIDSPTLCVQSIRSIGILEELFVRLVNGDPAATQSLHQTFLGILQESVADADELFAILEGFKTNFQ